MIARAVDAEAEAKRDNRLLTKAIASYLDVLKMNERLTDNRLLEVAYRTLDRIRFRGKFNSVAKSIFFLNFSVGNIKWSGVFVLR